MTAQVVIRDNQDALSLAGVEGISSVTEVATRSTFFRDGMTDAQLASNRRIVEISGATAEAAAASAHQLFSAAFVEERLAGFVICTRHADRGH